MRIHVCWVLILGLFFACDKHSTESLPSEPAPGPQLEFDPSLSPDSYSVYYVSVDKETSEHSLYRMGAASARRSRVFTGDISHSPSVSPDNKRVAYLDHDGLIRIYNIANKTISDPVSDQSFQSVLFVDNKNLVAGRGGALYWVDETLNEITYFIEGQDPTCCGPGSFACAVNQSGTWRIIRFDDFETPGTVIASISTSGSVRYPSIDRHTNRLSYSIQSGNSYSIRVAKPLNDDRHLQFSTYPRSVMVGADVIVMTGPGGRFYASDFLGSLYYPYIAEKDTEGPAKLATH